MAAWLEINSSHLDSCCHPGEAGGLLTEALDGTDGWFHDLSFSHFFVLDLGQSYNVLKVRSRSNQDCDPVDVDIFVSANGVDWGAAVATGISTWQDTSAWVEVDTTDKVGRYIKVYVHETEFGDPGIIDWGDWESPFTIFDVYVELPLVEIACTADAQSTAVIAKTEVSRKIALTSDGQSSAVIPATEIARKIVLTSDGQTTAVIAKTEISRKIVLTAGGQSTAVASIKIGVFIALTADAQSTAAIPATKVARKIAGTADGQTTAVIAKTEVARKVVCTSDGQSTAVIPATEVARKIVLTSDAQSTAVAAIKVARKIALVADGQSTAVIAKTEVLRKIVLTADGQLTAILAVFERTYIACTADGRSSAAVIMIVRHTDIPPLMDRDLVDPYSGGAWLWLVEIAVPGETTQRIARNTADVRYGGEDFDKSNIQIGEQIFTGDGSIPRVTLKVMQDINRTIEDLINDTEGALGAAVKLIRVNENFLDEPVAALEADYDNLASESDSEWVTFTLGMPNPLTQRFPLKIYDSRMCPEATPTLYKGPACQCVHGDGTCTGTYEDCVTKGNEVHFGAELGLDPNVVRI